MSFSVRRIDDGAPRRKFPWRSWLSGGLKVAGPLVQFLAVFERYREAKEREERRRHWVTTLVAIAVAVICAGVLWMGVSRAWAALRAVSVKTVINIAATDMPVDAHGHTNILLLGEGDEAGEKLIDTIMIASLDPKNGNAVLLSLPRDLYFLNMEHLGKGKINTFYRDFTTKMKREGKEAAEIPALALEAFADEVGLALEMDIHGAVKINFDGFVEGVDAMGGVDIDVPQDIIDTEYPTENYGYQTFEIKAGPQHLDGATALKYVRSRHTTSDFDRSARQQQVIAAIAGTVREQNLLKKTKTVLALQDVAQKHVVMTLDLGQVLGLAKIGSTVDRSKLITMQLSDRNGLYGEVIEPGGFLYTPPRDLFDGASVLLPVSIPEFPVTWKQIVTLKRMLIDVRTPYLLPGGFAVLNAGAKEGSGRKLATEMTRYGFTVDRVANASLGDQPASFIAASEEQYMETAKFFGAFLGIPVQPMPAALQPEERSGIVIMLGGDYAFTPFQSLTLPQ